VEKVEEKFPSVTQKKKKRNEFKTNNKTAEYIAFVTPQNDPISGRLAAVAVYIREARTKQKFIIKLILLHFSTELKS
jgi:hypothetical protein